ncbi:MAG: FmdB family transcriptional regulator [Candidatus Dadabacteria bacterium]
MPIYEYECEKCGRITEGFNDPPLRRCKYCRGKVNRIISLSSFQLMGTGWYATDYVKKPRIPSEVTKDNPALSGDANGSVNGNQSEKRSEPKETKKPRKSGMANMEKSDVKVE